MEGTVWGPGVCSRNAVQQGYLHHEKIASLSDKPSPCTTCGCAVHALPRPMALSKNSAPVVLGAMPLRRNPSNVAGPPWVGFQGVGVQLKGAACLHSMEARFTPWLPPNQERPLRPSGVTTKKASSKRM